jgi:hypothetical protein
MNAFPGIGGDVVQFSLDGVEIGCSCHRLGAEIG